MILNKIIEIEESLSVSIFPKNDISLFSGIGGAPIFYYSLLRLTGNPIYNDKITEYTNYIFDHLTNKKYGLSYNGGLAGVGFMLNFLKEKSIYPEEVLFDSLREIDEVLISSALQKSKYFKDLDFLHGSLGLVYYLNERVKDNPSLYDRMDSLVSKISILLLKDLSKYQLIKNDRKYSPNHHKTNCGLAHGLCSFITIFVDILKNFPHNEIVLRALKSSVSTLLEFASEDENSISVFPGIAVNKYLANYNVHLGWCYGDQTISLVLLKAGNFLNDEYLIKKAKSIAFKTLERATIVGAVRTHTGDAGFCHGTSSVAYLYKKWYKITGDDRFYKAYNFFIQETIRRSYRKSGIAGYQKYFGNDKYQTSIGLLDGVLGIGLVLADNQYDEEIDWDRLFILH